jgi:capsular exopolysaccharide synthesis family protein
MAQYEVTLRDYWRILRRRKGIVFFTGFLLCFFSFLIATVWQPDPLYNAVAKVQISLRQNLTGLYLQTIAYNSGDEIETQRAIITSHPVLKRTGSKLGMFTQAITADDSALVLLGLYTRINTSQEGFTNIISIETTDLSPPRARDLANTVAKVYRDYDHDLKNHQAVTHREFVEGQRGSARSALAEAEDAVRAYREKTDLISLESQASVNLQQITGAERDGQRLQQDLGIISDMVTEMESQNGISEKTLQGVSRIRVGDAFVSMNRQLNSLKLERDGLLVQYTEDHPRILRLQVQIDQIGESLLGELRQRKQALRKDLATERKLLSSLRGSYSQLPSMGLELSRLEREVAMRQQVVTALEEGYQEALIREADKVEEVTVLEWAATPRHPINPHHPLKRAIMGLLLGLILGVVFAVVAETLDTSIGTIEDVQEYTGMQVVGIVPFINVDDVRASLMRRDVDVSDDRLMQRKAQLVTYFDPQSTLAETYRTLRTNIEFVTVEKGAKCLMVTSSMHFEGKSTTISNLSMTMAQLGKRTLLVDCDLRKPSIARVFGLNKEPGVTEVIVGNHAWRDVIRTVTDIVTGGMGMEDILQTQGIGNLHIITSGSIPPNPTELLNSRAMGEFIDEIKEEYDVVLIDSPPVLHVTDAAILGKKVDGTLVVYKAGEVARTSLKRSTSLLRSVGIELLGVVLNGIRAEMSSDFHDMGYNAYYAYGSEVTAPERPFAQRVQDATRRWKKKLGLDVEDGEPAVDLGAEVRKNRTTAPVRLGDMSQSSPRSTAKTVLAYLAIILTGLGLLWQSGYLKKPLGLIPVLFGSSVTPAVEDEAPPATVAIATDGSSQSRSHHVATAVPDSPPPLQVAELGSVEIAMSELVTQQNSRGSQRSNPVTPDQSPPANSVGIVVEDAQPYVIRVASYAPGSEWSAQAVDELRQGGESAFLAQTRIKGRLFERLIIGRFASWDDAFRHANDLQDREIVDQFSVLRLPYSVELAQYPHREHANKVLKHLGDLTHAAHLRTTDVGDAAISLQVGAFETADEARYYIADVIEVHNAAADI